MNIKSLKATRFGRAMARLLGEEKGAVLMEYVVLAVLLVAAVVGAVIVFGNRISHRFQEAGYATTGDQNQVIADQAANQAEDAGNAAAAAANQNAINSGNYPVTAPR